MRVAALVPVRRFLRRIGAPVEPLLERLHLPPDMFADPEALIPAYAGSRFIDESARNEGLETLGTLAGEGAQLEDLGNFGSQLLQCPTVYDMIATARRIVPSYHSGETFWLAEDGAERMFCHRFTLQLDHWFEQTEQYALLTAVAFFRAVGGPRWHPTVHLKKDVPRKVRDSPLLADAELVFDRPVSGIAVPPTILHRSLEMTAEKLAPTARDLADWNASRPAFDFAVSLRQWMSGVIRTEAVRLPVVAETVGASPRTLQRRLAEAGTTYAHVLAEARFSAASRLLAHDDLSIRDVAREVGYPDAAHLTRAFRRWSGTTPSHFRRLQRADA
jgi:AraC-like DNA-binding protein